MTYQILGLKRANSRKYDKVIAEFETEDDVVNYLSVQGIKCLPNPYFFTHIKLDNNTIISSNTRGFTTSPEKLSERLKSEGFY
jgi:hypothetical protein